MKKNNNLRVVDLFAGGGGLSQGFSNAGYNILAAFDNWKPAREFYKANFKGHQIFGNDLGSRKTADIIKELKPDIIIGGPPCQDFSSAGKRDESLGRADLTVAYAKIVRHVLPKYFLMENVHRAIQSNAFIRAKKIFESSGYGLSVRILDASLCGVPQIRKRLIVVGELGGQNGFLDSYLDGNLSNKQMTLRDYFGDSLKIKYYYRHPRSYKRRGVFKVDEPSPTIRGVNRPIPKGYPGHPNDAAPIGSGVRPLTTKERSAIQTFPESFNLVGKKTDLEQIIGNAVPVKLAEYVALRLNEYILKKPSRKSDQRNSLKFVAY